jgi:hypothetical protein
MKPIINNSWQLCILNKSYLVYVLLLIWSYQ